MRAEVLLVLVSALVLPACGAGCDGDAPPGSPPLPGPGPAQPVPGPLPSLLAAGDEQACAVVAGRASCWGRLSPDDLPAAPTRAPALDGALDLAVAAEGACVVLSGGGLRCASPATAAEGRPVAGVEDATRVVLASGGHGFALAGGRLVGFTLAGLAAAPVALDGAVAALFGTGDGACVLGDDGRARCFEGDGAPAPDGPAASLPTELVALGGRGGRLCGITAARGLACPDPLPWLEDVVDVAVGRRHVCARREGGQVACFGADELGQLGDGGGPAQPVPRAVPGLVADALVAGADFSCALAEGHVRCFGADDWGQLGDGRPSVAVSPSPVPALGGVGPLVAGDRHTCAVAGSGARCVGLGVAFTGDPAAAGPSADPRPLLAGEALERVVAAGYVTCGLAEGQPRCAHPEDPSVDLGALGAGPFVGVATDGARICGRTARGPVRCAGPVAPVIDLGPGEEGPFLAGPGVGARALWIDARGRLVGDGEAWDLPGEVGRLAVGPTHGCAVLTDGSAFCFGSDAHGQQGDGEGTAPGPARRLSLEGVVGVAVGARHTCAWLADGTVHCAGDGRHGQLGDGARAVRDTLVAVPGLAGVVQVVAGERHTCARLADATVSCWGDGGSGQLGLPAHGPAPGPGFVRLP